MLQELLVLWVPSLRDVFHCTTYSSSCFFGTTVDFSLVVRRQSVVPSQHQVSCINSSWQINW